MYDNILLRTAADSWEIHGLQNVSGSTNKPVTYVYMYLPRRGYSEESGTGVVYRLHVDGTHGWCFHVIRDRGCNMLADASQLLDHMHNA